MRRRRSRAATPQQSIEELEWLRLTLLAIGGLYGDAVETQSWNTYLFLDDLLSDDSAPRDWVQNGIALWIEGATAGADLVRGMWSTFSRSFGSSDPQSGVFDDEIVFFVDKNTEATDPVETDIPRDQIHTVKVDTSGDIPKTCINLTVSGGKVLVALFRLTGTNLRKKRHPVVLTWGDKKKKTKTKFTVEVA